MKIAAVKIIGKSDEWREEENERAIGKWRIHNGEEFVRSYRTEEEATAAAEKLQAIAVGKLNEEAGLFYYTGVKRTIHNPGQVLSIM